MDADGAQDAVPDVQTAIERVLRVEREVEAALESARAQGRAAVAAAAERAARIAAHARERVAALHERCERRLQGEIVALGQAPPVDSAAAAQDPQRLERLVARVAHRLVRHDSGDSPQ